MPETTTSTITRHLRIHGLVQGVYYRQSMIDTARRLGLQGWVRNRLDGSVEAVASGPQDAVQALITWAHSGPPAARVQRVAVEAVAADELLAPVFSLRDTS